jgi:hypothetical protein
VIQLAAALPKNAQRALSPSTAVVRIDPASTDYKGQRDGQLATLLRMTTLRQVDYEEREVLCPHCGSKEVEQCWSVFGAITSKKSA